MRHLSMSLTVALAALALAPACKKEQPAEAPKTEAPKAEAPKAEEPKAADLPKPPSPAAMPGAVSATSAMEGPCPLPGEDPASCPTKPATVDDDIKIAHVLIGWDGSLPGKKAGRDEAGAAKLAQEVAHKARTQGGDFVKLIWEFSQDPGPGIYEVTPPMRRRFVPEFTAMALSLGVNQVDIVKTRFGFHVMKRVPFDFVAPDKPLVAVMKDPCPAEGEDQAACPSKQETKPTEVEVTHILIAYQGAMRSTATRTKEEAEKTAIQLCHDARKKGADFAKIKEAAKSDDPGPGTYPVSKDSPMVAPFKQLALSLGVGQVDVVESDFGYHVMKRGK
ncbi:MAG: peptidylprolyl isomerase [Deltaproteobacteria bacterium]|nr:peptidylprolyl isomerase [Deltaproteobacteria bacterium]